MFLSFWLWFSHPFEEGSVLVWDRMVMCSFPWSVLFCVFESSGKRCKNGARRTCLLPLRVSPSAMQSKPTILYLFGDDYTIVYFEAFSRPTWGLGKPGWTENPKPTASAVRPSNEGRRPHMLKLWRLASRPWHMSLGWACRAEHEVIARDLSSAAKQVCFFFVRISKEFPPWESEKPASSLVTPQSFPSVG